MYSVVLDDLCEVVGYSATRALLAWFGGRRLHVPKDADPRHPLCVLLGRRAFERLVSEYRGDYFDVPKGDTEAHFLRDKDIAERLARGDSVDAIAQALQISARWVRNRRTVLIERGWVEFAKGPPQRGRIGAAGTPSLFLERADFSATPPPGARPRAS